MTTIESDTCVLPATQDVNPAPTLLVVGAGYTGQRFAAEARNRGFRVISTRRTPGAV